MSLPNHGPRYREHEWRKNQRSILHFTTGCGVARLRHRKPQPGGASEVYNDHAWKVQSGRWAIVRPSGFIKGTSRVGCVGKYPEIFSHTVAHDARSPKSSVLVPSDASETALRRRPTLCGFLPLRQPASERQRQCKPFSEALGVLVPSLVIFRTPPRNSVEPARASVNQSNVRALVGIPSAEQFPKTRLIPDAFRDYIFRDRFLVALGR